ncbi:MAG: flagellar protein FliS [Rickettsiaceae bacterium]|nr:flagellar protein FliS [Rickettsiaceae bacterium]MDP4832646.1 flagellar protein FliS [Rickettsiaceae bacterium]
MKAFEKYRSTAVATSDTSRQLIFIFDEIMKLLHSAQKAMGERDHETKFKALSRVIEVFYILKSGVDLKTDDESNKALDTFYGATIVNLERINTTGEEPEELLSMIEAIAEVRSALVASVKEKQEENV